MPPYLETVVRVIQAASSVIALIIAIYIPIRIHHSNSQIAEDERQLKANALALFITADVFEIIVETIRALSLLEVCSTLEKQNYSRQEVISTLTIKSAQRLQPIIDNLWLLDRECGGSVNRAISFCLYINRKIDESFIGDNIPVKDLMQFHSTYGDDLRIAKKNAEQAISMLEKHYDLSIDGRGTSITK